jgi:hypothetical protein
MYSYWRLLTLAEHENSSFYAMCSTLCRNNTSYTCSFDTAQVLIRFSECLQAKMDETFPTRDGREAGRAGNSFNSAAFDCDFRPLGDSFDRSHIPDPHSILPPARVNGNMAVSRMGAYDPAIYIF